MDIVKRIIAVLLILTGIAGIYSEFDSTEEMQNVDIIFNISIMSYLILTGIIILYYARHKYSFTMMIGACTTALGVTTFVIAFDEYLRNIKDYEAGFILMFFFFIPGIALLRAGKALNQLSGSEN